MSPKVKSLIVATLAGFLWLVACAVVFEDEAPPKPYNRCLAKCVEWYSKVPYISDFPDSKELWQAIVDNKETTLSFEEWKEDVHAKRDHYAKYTYCPKACNDPDIYIRMGWGSY